MSILENLPKSRDENVCDVCAGQGVDENDGTRCDSCGGTGDVRYVGCPELSCVNGQNEMAGLSVSAAMCATCGGLRAILIENL